MGVLAYVDPLGAPVLLCILANGAPDAPTQSERRFVARLVVAERTQIRPLTHVSALIALAIGRGQLRVWESPLRASQ
jgi:hypothetical protein